MWLSQLVFARCHLTHRSAHAHPQLLHQPLAPRGGCCVAGSAGRSLAQGQYILNSDLRGANPQRSRGWPTFNAHHPMGGMAGMELFYDGCLEELYPPGSCGTYCTEHTYDCYLTEVHQACCERSFLTVNMGVE